MRTAVNTVKSSTQLQLYRLGLGCQRIFNASPRSSVDIHRNGSMIPLSTENKMCPVHACTFHTFLVAMRSFAEFQVAFGTKFGLLIKELPRNIQAHLYFLYSEWLRHVDHPRVRESGAFPEKLDPVFLFRIIDSALELPGEIPFPRSSGVASPAAVCTVCFDIEARGLPKIPLSNAHHYLHLTSFLGLVASFCRAIRFRLSHTVLPPGRGKANNATDN
ncbi:hypothetical protein R3P38DRAFT_951145 [Favolaschia claudopus]|uniref:Uncharacterized protein n=1 Tax=Favolaschia claudopus TaxID=2862362 RepID=A0AAW0BMM0_9AGAR